MAKLIPTNPTPGGGELGQLLTPEVEPEKLDPFLPLGVSGLRRFSNGYSTIEEEWLADLKGEKGVKAFREMADNDSTLGSVLFLIDAFTRKVKWEVDPANDDDISKGWAEFVESCIEDLEQSWANIVGEVIRGLCVYGFSTFEIVYKMRRGMKKNPLESSSYSDNKVGWGKIAPRSQDANYGWQFDANGEVVGMYHMPPPNYKLVYIPMEKLWHFTSIGTTKDNPQGRSPLRNCYIPYTLQKRIQISEAIGISRNLAGLPVMEVPLRLMSDNATAAEKQLLRNFQDMVSRIKADEYSGICIPSSTSMDGTPSGFRFQLMQGASGKAAETTPVLERLERNIARAFLADWLFLGAGSTGSWALASNKTAMFAQALGGFLASVTEVFNRGIAQLMRVNGNTDPATYPTIRHGDLEKMPLEEISGPLSALVSSGVISPDDELEEWMREHMGAPLAANRATGLDIEPAEPTAPEDEEIEELGEGPPPDDAEGVAEPDAPVSAVTLNGAQIASLLEIIAQVNAQQLPRATAVRIIATAFNMDAGSANDLLGNVGQGFEPAPIEGGV